jgi:hypothetical protein
MWDNEANSCAGVWMICLGRACHVLDSRSNGIQTNDMVNFYTFSVLDHVSVLDLPFVIY